jgi:hypothetical protein
MISAIDGDVRAVLNRNHPTQGSSVFRMVHLLVCSLNLEPACAAAASLSQKARQELETRRVGFHI